jgi:hypothetical protein
MTQQFEVPDGCEYYGPEDLKEEHQAGDLESHCLLIGELGGLVFREDKSLGEEREMITMIVTTDYVLENSVTKIIADVQEQSRMGLKINRTYDGMSQESHDIAEFQGILTAGPQLNTDYLRKLNRYFLKPEIIR